MLQFGAISVSSKVELELELACPSSRSSSSSDSTLFVTLRDSNCHRTHYRSLRRLSLHQSSSQDHLLGKASHSFDERASERLLDRRGHLLRPSRLRDVHVLHRPRESIQHRNRIWMSAGVIRRLEVHPSDLHSSSSHGMRFVRLRRFVLVFLPSEKPPAVF